MVGLAREMIRENVSRTRERIAEAARRAGRTADEITLVGVSKFQPLELLYAAVDCGVNLLGESRVQEAEDKRRAWQTEPPLWHMIGHLQRNKARKALSLFDCIESVDSGELAAAMERVLSEGGARPFPIFVEVNTSGEFTKHGIHPDKTLELFDTIIQFCPSLRLEGLMTIGPLGGGERAVRASFARLREMAESLRDRTGLPLKHLSMGMSGDFEWAIEEGSTFVRIGTGIFGIRIA